MVSLAVKIIFLERSRSKGSKFKVDSHTWVDGRSKRMMRR